VRWDEMVPERWVRKEIPFVASHCSQMTRYRRVHAVISLADLTDRTTMCDSELNDATQIDFDPRPRMGRGDVLGLRCRFEQGRNISSRQGMETLWRRGRVDAAIKH
jgi:hypothetical protein